jgi:molybdate transport system substrate-binding protein
VTVSRRQLLTAAGASALASGGVDAAGSAPLIAAASSLKGLLDEFAVTYERETRQRLRLVFGATSNLVRQIEQGAPYEVLLAADEVSVQRLADKRLTLTPPKVFALGQLSLIVRQASKLTNEGGVSGLRAAVDAGQIKRFAIANPELAPYGAAARQALQAAGLWDVIQPRLMLAETVALAASFVAMGGAEAGIIATSTLQLPGLANAVRGSPIPSGQHAPIRHAAAALQGASATAQAVLSRFTSPAQQARLMAHGFSAP